MSRTLILILRTGFLRVHMQAVKAKISGGFSEDTNAPQSSLRRQLCELSGQDSTTGNCGCEWRHQKVKEMLDAGVQVDTRDLNVGLTPLGHAAWFGHIETAQLLIERGADVNARKRDGTSVLMLATMRGHKDMAEILKKAGAKVSTMSDSSSDPIAENSRIRLFRIRFASSAWLCFALVCLIMAYVFIWQRGYYMDDYAYRNDVVDSVTNTRKRVTKWLLPDSPIRILLLPFLRLSILNIPEHELLMRTLAALIHGLNALLLGLIVHRALRSKLAAVVAGWLFLFPVFAPDAVLWNVTLTCTFALLFILTFQIALGHKKHLTRLLLIGALTFEMMLLFSEGTVAIYGLVIMFGAATLVASQPLERVRVLKRILLFMVPTTLILGFFALAYKYSDFVSSRGGVDFDLPHWLVRVEVYLSDWSG